MECRLYWHKRISFVIIASFKVLYCSMLFQESTVKIILMFDYIYLQILKRYGFLYTGLKWTLKSKLELQRYMLYLYNAF